MLTGFDCGPGLLPAADRSALPDAVWIDLVSPTEAEIGRVQELTGLRIPSREELEEVEASSRLNTERGMLYLSMPWVTGIEAGEPHFTPIGFVLSPTRLLTIRFAQDGAFQAYLTRFAERIEQHQGPAHVFVTILELLTERVSDVLERIAEELDQVSAVIFASSTTRAKSEERRLRDTLVRVGRAGDLISRLRDSLLGVGRITPYAEQTADSWLPADVVTRLRTLRGDVASLSDYDLHLANKVQFLLDATLGFISISQSNVIKVLTVVSVVFMPPTLFASIWGMNFKVMPELDWHWGYAFALGMIVLGAVTPLIWFRRNGWL
jgi:magnesium transporter